MKKKTWTRISLFISVFTIIFATLDILFIGTENTYNGYGILAVLPLSILGIIFGIIGSKEEESKSFNIGLLLNICLLVLVPTYYVFGTLIFGV